MSSVSASEAQEAIRYSDVKKEKDFRKSLYLNFYTNFYSIIILPIKGEKFSEKIQKFSEKNAIPGPKNGYQKWPLFWVPKLSP